MSTRQSHQRVMRLVEEIAPIWEERLDLLHIRVTHTFLDDGLDDGPDVYTAETTGRWQYREATILWHTQSAARWDDAHLEGVLVHELVHVLLMPEQTLIHKALTKIDEDEPQTNDEYDRLSTEWCERLELSTESVTRALLRAWPSAIQEASL